MIRLYLVRHGIAAEPGDFAGSDFARLAEPVSASWVTRAPAPAGSPWRGR